MADPVITALIARGARQRGLDPHAVLAVASVEGLGGGIGDHGTSFGPWQLHQGGALPGNIPLSRAHQWAWSPAGINYALDRIASVARGKRGRAAVSAIVSQFERPAQPGQEIQKALGRYGRVGGGAPVIAPANAFDAQPKRAPGVGMPGIDIGAIVSRTNEIVGLPALTTGTLSMPTAGPRKIPAPRKQPVVDMGGGFKHKRGKTINEIEAFARPFGVQITSTTHGNHVRGSYHYKGRAVDFGGDPRNMAALARAALSHPQDFAEMFYTGPGHPGAFIKNGQVIPLADLDASVYAHHKNHVHLAR